MTHLEENAIQTANEMDNKIERLKSELHEALQSTNRMESVLCIVSAIVVDRQRKDKRSKNSQRRRT